MKRRIVITGMGWVTPLGADVDGVWSRMVRGDSAVRPITRFDASTFATSFAAQVPDDVIAAIDVRGRHEHVLLNTRFALGAARQAWVSAGLDGGGASVDAHRVGIYLGAGEGVVDFENYSRANLAGWDAASAKVDGAKWVKEALSCMQPWREIEQESNMPVAHIANELGIRGPANNCLTACAASTQAIGEAIDILRRDEADIMLAGGAHTMIHPLGVTGFIRLTALSRRNDDPSHAARPFDRTRDGFVMGEGAGMVVLEELEHARARGAAPLAELVGYGSTADAFRITDMHPEGRGPAAAIRAALAEAGIDPSALGSDGRPGIHYISAHGTGTQENDSLETLAVKTVFGAHARSIPMSSIKSMTGHLIAAAGAVELITCVLAIRDQVLPPTINLREADPELDLDYVPNAARRANVETCLSNSFGFGGQNDTLIVRKFVP